MKALALIFLATGAATLADGCFRTASAQCAPGNQIYIDPRLVPQRQHITPEQFQRIWSTPGMPESVKNWAFDAYHNQFRPIQIPFRDGTVLISPTDPCVQQYIGPGPKN
jgi:hypothetical protein